MLISLLPVAFIIFIVLIILCIICSIFGIEQTYYKSNFVLPFDTNNYSITSEYGKRIDPISKEESIHTGIDVVPTSDNIIAIADGVVSISTIDKYGAEYIMIEHTIDNIKYRSSYWHLKEDSRIVKTNDEVKQGQQIGIMGSSGYSTGTHLHFALEKYNTKTKEYEYIDPSTIIKNSNSCINCKLYDYENNKYLND